MKLYNQKEKWMIMIIEVEMEIEIEWKKKTRTIRMKKYIIITNPKRKISVIRFRK